MNAHHALRTALKLVSLFIKDNLGEMASRQVMFYQGRVAGALSTAHFTHHWSHISLGVQAEPPNFPPEVKRAIIREGGIEHFLQRVSFE